MGWASAWLRCWKLEILNYNMEGVVYESSWDDALTNAAVHF